MTLEPPPLRFGIMCAGTVFPAWQARCLEELLALRGVSPGLLIVDPRPPARSSTLARLKRLARGKGVLWALYDRWFVRGRSEAMSPVDLSGRLSGVPVLRCEVARRGEHSEHFSDRDVAGIRRHGLDFILRFAFGIIRGEVLRAARFGVWSFHHGDLEKYRGVPPCFWEVFHGDPVTGAVLQRLTERLDGGVVLQRGYFRTIAHSYVQNRDAAYFRSASWPARVCRDLQNGAASFLEEPPSSTAAPILRNPTNRQMAVFALRTMRNALAFHLGSLLRAEQWNVGIVQAPIHRFLDPGFRPRVRWLRPMPLGRFLADPFAVARHGRITLLVEEYHDARRRGRISAVDGDGILFGAPSPAIEGPFHMSYPYLLEHGGEIYCIPETHETGEVVLYRAERFPDRWVRVCALLEGFPAVDATVFPHEGRWWLLCAEEDRGAESRLFAWHAPELSGPWTPHAANPLKTDVRSARPAGTPFVHGGRLYRPAQDGSRTYGGAVALNRVLRLTATDFAEEVVAVITPERGGPFPDGLHSLSAAGEFTVVDGKRRRFVPQVFRQELGAKLRRALRRGPAGAFVPRPPRLPRG